MNKLYEGVSLIATIFFVLMVAAGMFLKTKHHKSTIKHKKQIEEVKDKKRINKTYTEKKDDQNWDSSWAPYNSDAPQDYYLPPFSP